MGKNDVFWGLLEDENLHCETPDEAIEDLLDSLDFKDMFDTTVVHEYKRLTIDPKSFDAQGPVLDLLERLDEEFGDPCGDATQISSSMLAASEEFIAKVIEDYDPWACELTGKKHMVNTWQWIKEFRPDWIAKAQAEGRWPSGLD